MNNQFSLDATMRVILQHTFILGSLGIFPEDFLHLISHRLTTILDKQTLMFIYLNELALRTQLGHTDLKVIIEKLINFKTRICYNINNKFKIYWAFSNIVNC
uniref:hypothetical protein n=1 Tax=Hydrocytium acuminatum TaxID=1745963 RepID=UPI002A7FE06D|nr:hypothetical protein UYM18_pgp048 [Hydrocytium acuminatum]WOR09569.1 hypothetical protein [Hydrocytium acuminatum]